MQDHLDELHYAPQVAIGEVTPAPGWHLDDNGLPGAGQIPPGRVYAAEVVVTTNGMTESGTQHFAVDGDEVWNFPHACPHPGTSSGTGVA